MGAKDQLTQMLEVQLLRVWERAACLAYAGNVPRCCLVSCSEYSSASESNVGAYRSVRRRSLTSFLLFKDRETESLMSSSSPEANGANEV